MKKCLHFVFLMYSCAVGAASCPAGYVAVDVPDIIIADVCPVETVSVGGADSCVDGGAVCWLIEQVRARCGGGFSQIKTDGGVVVPLYSDRATDPSFCVQYNDTICYADMVPGRATGTINVQYNDVVYHLE